MAVHHFGPTRYFNTRGSHEPVLRIEDGDTHVTSTVEAAGKIFSGQDGEAPSASSRWGTPGPGITLCSTHH